MNSLCFRAAAHRYHFEITINSSICCMRLAMRHHSTHPSREEVLKAYDVLGVSTSAPYADVKKKYISLAKLHHPDIVHDRKNEGGNNRMVDINNAYHTVSRFLKGGHKFSESDRSSEFPEGSACHSSSSGKPEYAYGRSNSYGTPYQAWYEDLDPLLYEMMWEDIRNEKEGNYRMGPSMSRDHFQHPGTDTQQHRGDGKSDSNAQSHHPYYERRRFKARDNNDDRPKSSTKWSEPDVKAMVNMYQDGKSFEFIANALGKQTLEVVKEFNRWSEGNDKNRRSTNFSKHRHPGQRKGSFYHAEFPDDPPYDFYDVVDDDEPDEDRDMFGYCVGEECGDVDPLGQFDYGNGPIPFNGVHFMNGVNPSHVFKANYGKGFHKPHRNAPPGRRWKRDKNSHSFSSNHNARGKN